jgi:DNA-binding GntR family transcriptional regulator
LYVTHGSDHRGALVFESRTLREQVRDVLYQRISTGLIPAGSRLNESEIAAELDISRGPIREAIQTLVSDGLVVIQPHRGAFVRSLDETDIRDLFEMRVALEVHATRLAARNVSITLRRTLNELLAEAGRLLRSADDAPYPPSLDIHEAIISACGVPRLQRALSSIHQELALVRARSGWKPQRAKAALREHRAIVRAVSAGGEGAAADAMYTHLRAAASHAGELH